MNQILSQSEVDALLAAVTDGDIKPAEEASASLGDLKLAKEDTRNIISYDSNRPDGSLTK